MKKYKSVITALIPIAVGALSSLIAGNKSMGDYNTPPLSPPDWLFPIAWTVLYALIGISSAIVLKSEEGKLTDRMKYFYYNLALNFSWPILFFRFKMYTACVVVLLLMIIMSVAAAKGFWDKSKTAGTLMLPYIAWLMFALYLNIGVAVLNPVNR